MEESPSSKKPKIGTVDSIIMCSIYVLMLSDSMFFIKLNDDGPNEYLVDEHDAFDVWCKKMTIVPYTIEFEGKYLRNRSPMKRYNTTSSSYITITERVIYYHFNGEVKTYKQSPEERLSSLFAFLKHPCLVAHINGEIFTDDKPLSNMQTDASNPLYIIPCICSFQVENRRPQEKLCDPLTAVEDVKLIKDHVESLDNMPYVLYHNGKEISRATLLQRLCVPKEPIIIKSLKMKIFVDCKEIKIPVDEVVSLVELIDRASVEVQRDLKEEAFDVYGSKINSLNEFIMNTNEDRQLHLEGTTPYSPSYTLPSSVSDAASKHPETISDEDDNFDDWCKKMSIVPYEINFKGERVRKGNLMSGYNTTSSSYITITERVIYYHFNGEVDAYKQSPEERLSSLFAFLKHPCLVAHKNGEFLTDNKLLSKIQTDASNPLYIIPCICSFQVENRRHQEELCDPLTAVKDVKLIKSHIESLDNMPYVLYHNGKEISQATLLQRLCVPKEPIIIKSLKIKIIVDGKEIKIPVDEVVPLVELINRASVEVQHDLKEEAFDVYGSKINSLNEFIMNTNEDRQLHLEGTTPYSPSYTLPSSVSDATSKHPETISKYSDKCPLYAYWFCLEVYDILCSPPDDAAKDFFSIFQKIMNTPSEEMFHNYELTYSSMLGRELDRYLFENKKHGCVLYQPVLAGRQHNRPDGYVAKLEDSKPSKPWLVYDFKKQNMCHSATESLGYCEVVISNMKYVQPLFIMPCTQTDVGLSLCWPKKLPINKFALINICEGKASANYFNAIKYAVNNFDFPARYFEIEPIKSTKVQKNLVKNKDNIYLADGKVYKIYDTDEKPYAKPNKMVIEEVLGKTYLSGIEETILSKDGRFQCLQYDYIEARRTSDLSIDDFRPIMKTLDILHDKGYVHSDVRYCNMVFPANGTEAKLIDFDLMARVDEPYPKCYNNNREIPERHRGAAPNKPRKKLHDRHSMIFIILKRFENDLSPEKVHLLESFQTNDNIKLDTFFDQ